jgi:hypothetical protein
LKIKIDCAGAANAETSPLRREPFLKIARIIKEKMRIVNGEAKN